MLTAPEIAQAAEAEGVKMIVVHGRTRRQFYKGRADWSAVRATVESVRLPVLVNGDIETLDDVRRALVLSGAEGVMIGRAAIGRPWIAGAIAKALESGAKRLDAPSVNHRIAMMIAHYRDIIGYYGAPLGLRMARKHLAGFVETLPLELHEEARRSLRAQLCQMNSPARVEDRLAQLAEDAASGRAGEDGVAA